MMQTFDFIGIVWRDEKLKSELIENMSTGQKKEIIIEMYRLFFDYDKKIINISCNEPDYIFARKIVPVEITYESMKNLIDKKYESVGWKIV